MPTTRPAYPHPRLTNALRADLRATQAKAFARMEDTRNAVRTTGLAEEAAAKIDRAAEPPETSYIQPGLIEEQLAETLRRLGDLPTALSYIERSSTMPTHARGQANRLVILTRIAVALGDLDYAADAIRWLLSAARGMDSQRFRDRLRSIRSSIEQHRASASKNSTLGLHCRYEGEHACVGRPLARTSSWPTWFSLNLADVELPDGRHLDHYLLRQPPVAIAAIMNDRDEVLLLWRHRFIPDSWAWELPSGKVEDGEDFAAAAAREALEETGWEPKDLHHLMTLEVSGGFSDARHHVYWADQARHVDDPIDAHESDRVACVPLGDVPDLVARGEIRAAHTVAALFALRDMRAGRTRTQQQSRTA